MQRSTTLTLDSAKVLRSNLIQRPKARSPLLMLSAEKDGCRSNSVYNPYNDRVYETKSDFSGYRFLGNSESFKGSHFKILRDGEENVKHMQMADNDPFRDEFPHAAEDLRGRLWVEDKNGNYVVVWQFEKNQFLGFCRTGDDHYREIPTQLEVQRELRGLYDMVLKGYNLYVFATREFIRHLDLSGQDEDGFKDVSEKHRLPMWMPRLTMKERESRNQLKCIPSNKGIAVTRAGQVLLVYTFDLGTSESHRMFRLYKRDPKDLDPKTLDTWLLEVHSLGDEALFLDLGITVPADHTLGIEPNSIYFTRGDRIRHKESSCLDICVFNLITKTIKRFHGLSNFNFYDAQWFLPS
ncbi:hypothetical protein ISN45_Un14g000080 [Arabidopsis thaliana x Arabidopsis arenosa]|uniref:KIB1-4 beta-propeller domain-containing protein n=1 Tax=Arabidopsis thaliana x Arabidopsis arenosa TaxID=1240361 RepID=A0A8T1XKD3_9BRAS|nr:hypothetical protein ISN45_Un14g000080 [Arabidopsis thaliana x Arabidopsis arenosa]